MTFRVSSSLRESFREPTSTWLLAGLPGREEGGAQLQIKGILLPVCPRLPDQAGYSHSKKRGEGQRVQTNGLSVLTKEMKGEHEHARMHASQAGPRGAWPGELGVLLLTLPPGSCVCRARFQGRHVLPAMGLPGMQRWRRHSSATQSSLRSLRAGRPVASAQGWVGPTLGTDTMTITLRIEPPISLGPQQSTSPLNLNLTGRELPEQGSALAA